MSRGEICGVILYVQRCKIKMRANVSDEQFSSENPNSKQTNLERRTKTPPGKRTVIPASFLGTPLYGSNRRTFYYRRNKRPKENNITADRQKNRMGVNKRRTCYRKYSMCFIHALLPVNSCPYS